MALTARTQKGLQTALSRWRGLAPEWRRGLLGYSAYMLALLTLLWPSVASIAHQWLSSSSFHHAPLAAPLALWLILRERNKAVPPRPFAPALFAIAVIAGVWFAGRVVGASIVEHLALVSLLIAGAVFFFGARNARNWAFPLAFLFFLVPFGVSLQPALQETAAVASNALLNLAGLDAVRHGLVIATSAGVFEIAEACSGLNFLLASLMVSSFFAAVAFADWGRRAAFVGLAIAAAVIANIARVTAVIGAAELTGDAYSIGSDHIVFGWAFYAVMLFALVSVGRWMAMPRSAVLASD